MTQYYDILVTAKCRLYLETSEHGLTEIAFISAKEADLLARGSNSRSHAIHGPKHLQNVRNQLQEYFAGKRQAFELELDAGGTAFQRRVWQKLCQIPFGETATYGELAKQLGNANASRAVGMANGKNPIAIVVPCHRVIGANGTLTGYAGGLENKEMLLRLEGIAISR